jgi:hypothetical protein
MISKIHKIISGCLQPWACSCEEGKLDGGGGGGSARWGRAGLGAGRLRWVLRGLRSSGDSVGEESYNILVQKCLEIKITIYGTN